MTQFLFSNFAESTLERSLRPTDAILFVPPGDAGKFPVPFNVDLIVESFALVLQDGVQDPEIVYATTNPLDGSFDIERGREGTSAKAWGTGTLVTQALTRDTLGTLAVGGNGWISHFEDELGSANAQITIVAETVATNHDAFASYQIDVAAQFASNNASVNQVLSSFADVNTAWGQFQTDINATVGDYTAGFTEDIQALVDSGQATTTNFNSLNASFGTFSASFTDFQSATADQFTATTSSITALTATVNSNYTTLSASIDSEAAARASADSAEATARQAVQTNLNTETTNRTAAVTAEQTARVNADAAEATARTTVQSNLNTLSASVTTTLATKVDNSRLSAKVAFTARAGNVLTGMTILAANNTAGDTPISEIRFGADKFYFEPAAGITLVQPMVYDSVSGQLRLNSIYVQWAYMINVSIVTAQIQDLAVTNAKIGNLAVDNGKIANLAVDNGKIANLAVDSAKIADLAVTNAKIGNAAVDSAKIGSLAVQTLHIANANVTSFAIADDGSNWNLNTTDITVFSISKTMNGTGPALLFYRVDVVRANGGITDFKVYKDGTQVDRFEVDAQHGVLTSYLWMYRDNNPTAASHTYTVTANAHAASGEQVLTTQIGVVMECMK